MDAILKDRNGVDLFAGDRVVLVAEEGEEHVPGVLEYARAFWAYAVHGDNGRRYLLSENMYVHGEYGWDDIEKEQIEVKNDPPPAVRKLRPVEEQERSPLPWTVEGMLIYDANRQLVNEPYWYEEDMAYACHLIDVHPRLVGVVKVLHASLRKAQREMLDSRALSGESCLGQNTALSAADVVLAEVESKT